MNTILDDAPVRRVELRDGDFRAVKPMLQAGVGVPAPKNKSVRQFLTGDLGFDPDYVEGRLQTVFLDGAPVDDFDTAMVLPGCTLALSGAMPGLAGATMRRGGYFARMREGIAHDSAAGKAEDVGANPDGAIVTVKLFNKALADLARDLIQGRPLLVNRRWLADLPIAEDAKPSASVESVWLTFTFAE
jgi:hypothetical protein